MLKQLYSARYLFFLHIMEGFLKLPQNLQTQKNLDRLLDAEAEKRELEQKRLKVEELRLEQTGNDLVTWALGHRAVCT